MGKIALPTGEDLGGPTEALFAEARITIGRKSRRSYDASLSGLPVFTDAIFCKPAEIPRLISRGRADFGITGMDCVREYGGDPAQFRILAELDYACAGESGNRCAIFCRDDMQVTTIFDIGMEPSIITEYPQETRDRLREAGISDAKLESCRGGAEALVKSGEYPFGVALVATGSTLRDNNLKVVDVIFTSKTVIIGRAQATDDETEEAASFLGKLLRGTLDARTKTYLVMHVPTAKMDTIRNKIPAMKTPTIQRLDEETLAVGTVVPNSLVNTLIFQLMREGASAFVTKPVTTVM